MDSQKSNGLHSVDWGGSGPVVHIAHAAGLAAGVYEPLAEKLTPHFSVRGTDIRGHGRSPGLDNPSSLTSWEVLYNDLIAFLEQQGSPVAAIGHSMGGTISLVAAARRPDLISALILIDPGVMAPAWRPWVYLVQKLGLAMHVPFVTRVTRRKHSWPDTETARADLYGKGPFRKWRDEFFEAYLEHALIERPDGTVGLACDPMWEGRCLAMAPTDIWKYVPIISVPTLIMYGTESTTFLPSVVRRFKDRLPGVTMMPFENAGHYLPMENPGKCADAISGFLNGL